MPTGAIYNPRMSLPITEKQQTTGGGIGYSAHPAFYIATYIFFSNLTILFNKWLIDTAGFPYPIFLTCWHMGFSAIATQILARTTRLIDGRKQVKMTGRTYMRAIMPIGLMYSGSLVCSNLTYLYLSVPFIQMLKAISPVSTLFVSWIWGVANPSWTVFFKILVIVFGVALASFGEIHFQWMGFWYQTSGIVFESIRLVMTQILLSGDGQKMDPLVSLYYYAPVCAVMNVLLVWYTEFATFKMEDFVRVGPAILVINASVAFMLNIASLFLVFTSQSKTAESYTDLDPDWEDQRLGGEFDRHFQVYPPCPRRRRSLGHTNQLATTAWLHFGTRRHVVLFHAARSYPRTFCTNEEGFGVHVVIIGLDLDGLLAVCTRYLARWNTGFIQM